MTTQRKTAAKKKAPLQRASKVKKAPVKKAAKNKHIQKAA